MSANILGYCSRLKQIAEQKVSALLSQRSAAETSRIAFDFDFSDSNSLAFQHYYYQTVLNQSHFLASTDFFRVFKQKYALQGIDNAYLDHLEQNKPTILQLINDDRPADLYFGYFAGAPIRRGGKTSPKNLGSFFAKLMHTFRPDSYCALDNPIKNYLGLKGESFYIAFVAISDVYKEWAEKNDDLMKLIRQEFEGDPNRMPFISKMTNLKLLDLILWYQAHKLEKNQR